MSAAAAGGVAQNHSVSAGARQKALRLGVVAAKRTGTPARAAWPTSRLEAAAAIRLLVLRWNPLPIPHYQGRTVRRRRRWFSGDNFRLRAHAPIFVVRIERGARIFCCVGYSRHWRFICLAGRGVPPCLLVAVQFIAHRLRLCRNRSIPVSWKSAGQRVFDRRNCRNRRIAIELRQLGSNGVSLVFVRGVVLTGGL